MTPKQAAAAEASKVRNLAARSRKQSEVQRTIREEREELAHWFIGLPIHQKRSLRRALKKAMKQGLGI